jgi:hypothetical protein
MKKPTRREPQRNHSGTTPELAAGVGGSGNSDRVSKPGNRLSAGKRRTDTAESYFGAVFAEVEARSHRLQLIMDADDRCQGRDKWGKVCGWLAYTRDRQAQLSLRPKLAVAGNEASGEWVLCPTCTQAWDTKHGQQRKAS